MIDFLNLWRDHFIPGPALDIGAGDGEVSLWLAAHGFTVDALEPDQHIARMLHSRFDSSHIQLHSLDILNFPLPTEHYAIIIASAVLHFIERKQLPMLAKRMIGSLISGGMLFAAVFTTDDPASQDTPGSGVTRVRHFFKPGELRQLFHPLEILGYEESRRAAPDSVFGFRSGATLVARRPSPT